MQLAVNGASHSPAHNSESATLTPEPGAPVTELPVSVTKCSAILTGHLVFLGMLPNNYDHDY